MFALRSGVFLHTGLSLGLVLGITGLPVRGQATRAASAPTSRPASQPDRIERLIAQLGNPDFRTREDAQKSLMALGGIVLPDLMKHITDPDPEIARRVLEILPLP